MSWASSTPASLPFPPETLAFDRVTLRFVRILPGDLSLGLVPAYHFCVGVEGVDVGHINFRVGHTPHVLISAGHIGFAIGELFRGHRYAWQSCRAIAAFVRTVYPSVIITCDPDNHASRRTIERLGASFLNEVPVPPEDPQYQRGSRFKRRYEWTP